MGEALFWLYRVDASLLAVHEMDSAYWKEWELFHLPGGLGFFLLLHLPLLGAVFWGMAAAARGQTSGPWFALGPDGAGALAFRGGFGAGVVVNGRPENGARCM